MEKEFSYHMHYIAPFLFHQQSDYVLTEARYFKYDLFALLYLDRI